MPTIATPTSTGVLINAFTSSRRRRWVGERPTAVVPEAPVEGATADFDATDAFDRSLG